MLLIQKLISEGVVDMGKMFNSKYKIKDPYGDMSPGSKVFSARDSNSNQFCISGSGFGLETDHVIVDMDAVYALKKAKSLEELSVCSMNSSDGEEIFSTSEKPSHLGGPCLTCYKRYQLSMAGNEHNTKRQAKNLSNDKIKGLKTTPYYVKYPPGVVQSEKYMFNVQHQHEKEKYCAENGRYDQVEGKRARHENSQSSNDTPSDKKEDDSLENNDRKIDDGINFKTSLKTVNIKEQKAPACKGDDDVNNILTKPKPVRNGWVGANVRGSNTVTEFSNIFNSSNSPQGVEDNTVKKSDGFRRYSFSRRSEKYIKAITANRKERKEAAAAKIKKIRDIIMSLREKEDRDCIKLESENWRTPSNGDQYFGEEVNQHHVSTKEVLAEVCLFIVGSIVIACILLQFMPDNTSEMILF